MYKRRSFSLWYFWYHKCDMLARWSQGVNTGGSLTQLITGQRGHIGRSIWPLAPVRPLECKRLLQNIADTCDLKTSAHKQLDWNEMINPFRLNAPELVTQFTHTCHRCLFHLYWSIGISTVLCRNSSPICKARTQRWQSTYEDYEPFVIIYVWNRTSLSKSELRFDLKNYIQYGDFLLYDNAYDLSLAKTNI